MWAHKPDMPIMTMEGDELTSATTLDRAAVSYAGEVVRRLHWLLDARLHAVYLMGSLALGDYLPGKSDIDIWRWARDMCPWR
jgi:hypothetical protein